MKKNIIKNKSINADIFKGSFSKKDQLAPAYINVTNPKYIEIDNYFYSGFLVVNYNREYNDILLKRIIDTNINMNISIFYEKQDSYKTIRDLTYNIANVGVELKEENQNRQDIYSNDLNELEYLINKVEGILQSIGLQTKRATFRQEQTFLSCLPLMKNHNDILRAVRRNVLTSGLIGTYPFISSAKFDEDGIFFGTNIYNDSLVFIDKYNTEKYKNANMCVFGTSGARKILFCKITNY